MSILTPRPPNAGIQASMLARRPRQGRDKGFDLKRRASILTVRPPRAGIRASILTIRPQKLHSASLLSQCTSDLGKRRCKVQENSFRARVGARFWCFGVRCVSESCPNCKTTCNTLVSNHFRVQIHCPRRVLQQHTELRVLVTPNFV